MTNSLILPPDQFVVSPNVTRVSVMTYGSEVTTEFCFNEFTSNQAVTDVSTLSANILNVKISLRTYLTFRKIAI